ncbi:MAG TPA: Na+/H+ antiporter subunit E [Terrimesophilobacter sp.]|uniref:Na+/H+ antiporter subunit E n=1 Tax=Terrimesophilobacter sp. TaxID=2906435 RepID=UPI002F95178A
MKGREVSNGEVRRRLLQQLPLLVGLILLWMVLWNQFTVLSLLTGVAVAVIVTRVFYLPPVELPGRINLWYTLVFLAHFFLDVALASFQVAFQALNPRPIPRSSVIGIQLRTRSDLIMTLDAIAMSLVPGSLVVEADRERGILYLHTFATRTKDDVEAMRRKVLVVEARIVRAIGSREDLARIGEAGAGHD